MKNIVSITTIIVITLLSGLVTNPEGAEAQGAIDYDKDDDGLIEIEWLEQLNAIRWDLNGDGYVDDERDLEEYAAAFSDSKYEMGCENGCEGYELARSLDFRSSNSYAAGKVNNKWASGNGWLPIGFDRQKQFRATFDGNGNTIDNLHIDRSGDSDPGTNGLFGSSRGNILRIGLINVDVSGQERVGGLVGWNDYGTVVTSYVTGEVSGTVAGGLVGSNTFASIAYSSATVRISGSDVGGLVGASQDSSISGSFAHGNVSGTANAGGLVGFNASTKITSSYATGSVSGEWSSGGLVGFNSDGSVVASYATGGVTGKENVGGLVGSNVGRIASSYAIGNVSGEHSVGGLVGRNEYGSIKFSYTTSTINQVGNYDEAAVGGLLGTSAEEGVAVASYWLRQLPIQHAGVGEGSSSGVRALTAKQIKEPLDYTGVFLNWLVDMDNADEDYDETTGKDDFWDFGTSSEYPVLKVDVDGDGIATWWEGGSQHGRSAPTPTPTPAATPTPTRHHIPPPRHRLSPLQHPPPPPHPYRLPFPMMFSTDWA